MDAHERLAANQALLDLKQRRIRGAKVLLMHSPKGSDSGKS